MSSSSIQGNSMELFLSLSLSLWCDFNSFLTRIMK